MKNIKKKCNLFIVTFLISANLAAQNFGAAYNNKINVSNWSCDSIHLKTTNSKVLNGFETWTPLPLFAGEVTSIARDQNNCNIAYLGTRDAGVYRTLDGGQSWQSAREGLTFVPIRKLVVDPVASATLYAGTDFDGIWKTIDSCKTWTRTNYPGELIVFNIVIDAINNSILYAGEAGGIGLGVGHLYKSIDAGESWSLIENGLPEYDEYINGVFSLAIDPSNSQILYTGTNNKGIFKTEDGGNTWISINVGIPSQPWNIESFKSINALFVSNQHPVKPYALIDGNFYKYINNEWVQIAGGYIGASLFPGELHFFPGDSTKIYTDTYFSEDAGLNWSEYLNNATNDRIGFSSLSCQLSNCNNSYGAVAGYNGAAISSDFGKTWNSSSTGITGATVLSVAIDHNDPTTIFAGTSENLHYSIDSGETWEKAFTVIDWGGGYTETIYTFSNVNDIQIHHNNSNIIYLSASGELYRSHDRGVSFTNLEVPGGIIRMPKNSSSGEIYIAGRGVRKSVDDGVTWTPLNTGLPLELGDPVDIQSFAFDPSDISTMWVGLWHFAGLYKTVDGGANWVEIGLTDESIVSAVAIHPENSNVIFAGVGYGIGKIVKSIDGGETWETKIEGIAMPTEFLFDPRGSNQIYVATEGWGILRSIDGGESWQEYDNGIFYPLIYSIDISSGQNPQLIAGSYGSGVYNIIPTYHEPQSIVTPSGSSKWKAFPNPTTGRINLLNTSPKTCKTNAYISIFSGSGVKIVEMCSRENEAISINLSNHSSGLYLVLINNGTFVESIRVVINK